MSNSSRVPAREVPTGWPVGSFKTYAEAQAAVDSLSDKEFPVEKLSIVGVDLMQVEKITGRLTWGKVLGTGALSGLWMGLFIGLILSVFTEPGSGWVTFTTTLILGDGDRGGPLRRALRAGFRTAGARPHRGPAAYRRLRAPHPRCISATAPRRRFPRAH